MKNKTLSFILLVVFTAALIVNLNSNSLITSARAEDPGRKCYWEQYLCPDGVTYFEACLVGGNGKKCGCGLVTNDCPGSN